MAERHPELDAEQAHLDWAYTCLDAARDRAARVTSGYDPQRGGTEQHRHERESIVEGAVNRLSQLNLGDRSLVFGRIDPTGTGERFYIGRLGVWDKNQDPVVVDWRAPVAEPFYRATGREPMGIERRRHFATRGRTLLGIDDEVFGELASADGETEVKGQGALIAAIEASRTGRLGDIVATIQGEQDEIIRAPMPGVLLVQGGPGTGKTVVALHRAAYLLYTHRFPLEGQGVLVVGPNRLFLAYIEQVLPSLGEAGVEIAVLGDLLRPRVRVDALDPEPVAAVKGDLRMVKVLAQAVDDRERPLREDLAIGFGIHRLKLTVADSRDIIREARRRSKGHNAGRKIVEELLFAKLAASARRPVEASNVRDQLRWELPIREVLEWMWPVLTPAHLLHDLFGSRALLRSANRKGHFTDEEIVRLHRPRARHADDVVWRFNDVPLLDEARALLGYRPGKRDEDAVRTYGHICIDEAQDLAPMELRTIARRSLNGSMTVVGDIAQATGAWANDGWDNVLAQLPQKRELQRRELSIGYRIPGPAMSLANQVLPYAAPGLRPPQPVRDDGDPPKIVAADDLGDVLVDTVLAELDAVDEGNVAVIVPDSMVDEVRGVFERRDLAIGGANRHGLDQRITLVPVRLVKGLEVDSAVVVEPARIIDEESQGIRSLYVALTRATKRVAVVHAQPLPEMLQE
ncbi:MAG: DNA/RNA helicase domain-containing protein [Actinomycetota bacterium]